MEKRTSAAARLAAAIALLGAVWSSSWSSPPRRVATTPAPKGSSSQPHEGRRKRSPAPRPKPTRWRSGDTLTAIAHKTGVPARRILALNPEVDPQILIAGADAAAQVRPRRQGALLLSGDGFPCCCPRPLAQPARATQSPEQQGPQLAARCGGWSTPAPATSSSPTPAIGELPIASTTKLMTAYVAIEEMPLDKIVRAQPYRAEYGESLMGLRAGERISVRDLIYGLILRSGNDAAHTLAIAAAGSEQRFVAKMNRYAAALGLSHTHYANPMGSTRRATTPVPSI